MDDFFRSAEGLVTALTALAVALAAAFTAAWKLLQALQSIRRLNIDQELTWTFLSRRGLSEIINRGLGELTSEGNLLLSSAVYRAFRPYIEELKDMRRVMYKGASDGDFFKEVERRFGDEFAKTVCVTLKLQAGACLVAAAALASEP